MSLTIFSTYKLGPDQRGVISEEASAQQMKNATFRVSVAPDGDGVRVTVQDIAVQRKVADGPGKVAHGRYQVEIELPPWGAEVGAFRSQ